MRRNSWQAVAVLSVSLGAMFLCGVPLWIITLPLWLPAIVVTTAFGIGIVAAIAEDLLDDGG